MVKLRVRALPHGAHPFFRRGGHTFFVGADVVADFDEETEALLRKEETRLKVERVPGDTPATRPAPPPPVVEPPPGPKVEVTEDGDRVPMVGGAAAKGSRRS